MGNFVSKKVLRRKKTTKFSQDSRKTVPEAARSVPESTKSVLESVTETRKNIIQESSNINGKKQVPAVPVTKLYIIYYSMYGHVERLAQEIKKGAETVEGIEATLWQIPETLPEEVLTKMHAPPRSNVPVIDVDQLPEADAFLFGFPTRFGMMPAQFKAFFDATGGIWREQKLAGKPAGLFHSTGSQGGGQETTAWTTITILANHAMLYVPPGYTSGAGMVNLDVVKGGSPYGAGTIAGSGSLADKEPNELELEQSFHQGKYTAAIAKKMKSTA